MLEFLFNLQLFADGDGGDSSAPEGVADAGDEIPSSIPARAREIYKKAMGKTKAPDRPVKVEEEPKAEVETATEEKTHTSYRDLIKSDDYKDEHEAYMKEVIADRLKKYKGIEQTSAKQSELLSLVAQKYGLNPGADNYMEALEKAIGDDDSYYESYAMEHDMSPQEARKIVSLERKVAEQERQQQIALQEAENRRINQIIISNAEKCKQQFPQFDLDTEWKNPDFIRLAAATNWDITATYKTIHWNDIVPQAIKLASQTATNQTANAVKANKSRPVENGLGASSPATLQKPDYSKMNLDEIREQAARWRRGEK